MGSRPRKRDKTRPSKRKSNMVNLRRAFYNALLLSVPLLPAAGCGKPAPPPAGSAQSATTPTVDLGTESNPKEAGAGSTDSSSGSGSPQGEQGEQK
jgi:hypothetical protein